MIRPSTRKLLHETKANSSATFRPQEGRRKRVSNAILKKRTLFLTVLTTLLLVTLFLLPNSLNPSDKGDRGLAQEKHNVMEAAFAEIREKVDKEKVDYSDDWRVSDMWESLKCEEIFKSERPIHSQTDWLFSRSLYRGIVGSSQSSIGSSDGDVKNGFQYKVEAKQAPPKGRGIFALEDIKKGTLIWSTTKTARFRDGPSYRKFIFGLEAGFACDVLQWGKSEYSFFQQILVKGCASYSCSFFHCESYSLLFLLFPNLCILKLEQLIALSSLCSRCGRWGFTYQC